MFPLNYRRHPHHPAISWNQWITSGFGPQVIKRHTLGSAITLVSFLHLRCHPSLIACLVLVPKMVVLFASSVFSCLTTIVQYHSKGLLTFQNLEQDEVRVRNTVESKDSIQLSVVTNSLECLYYAADLEQSWS